MALGWVSAARATRPMTLAVLPPYPAIEDTNLNHWGYCLPLLLKDQLREVKAIRIPPDSSFEFGPDDSVEFGKHEIKAKAEPGLSSVVKIGQVLEARKVVWSSYRREGNGWSWSALIVDVPTGKTSRPLIATSSNWPEVIRDLRRLILKDLGVSPTVDEQQCMDRPLTRSSAAFEALSSALDAKQLGKPLAVVEAGLRKALALDPGFVEAQEALATVLIGKNETDEAAQILKRTLKARPDSARVHYLLGDVYMVEDLKTLAREQYLKAQQLAPTEPLPLVKLAQLSELADNWKDAVSLYEKAKRLEEFNSLVHAGLGNAYAHLGQRNKAIDQLRIAEHCDWNMDLQIALRLADTYAFLHETPLAVEYNERFLTGAKRVGLNTPAVAEVERTLAQLKARLSPHFVQGTPPRDFRGDELDEAMKRALTYLERNSITNPFSCTPAMTRWGKELTTGGRDDFEKTQRLFAGLTRHIDLGMRSSGRTAEQAYRDWREPQANLSCQDYTFLFVALARAAGLKAYYVVVNQDYQSNLVAHACAGVFVGGKALLVDPAYGWFGVPHANFQFQNDLQATAFYIAQSGVPALQEAAVKLQPEQPLLRFFLAMDLAFDGKAESAREALEAGLKRDSKSWWSFFARGVVELAEKNVEAAMKDLEDCAALHPQDPRVHFYLAEAYQRCQRQEDARDEYRAYVQEQDDLDLADTARERISYLNAVLDKAADAAEFGTGTELLPDARPTLGVEHAGTDGNK